MIGFWLVFALIAVYAFIELWRTLRKRTIASKLLIGYGISCAAIGWSLLVWIAYFFG